jgi:hypothetical protein
MYNVVASNMGSWTISLALHRRKGLTEHDEWFKQNPLQSTFQIPLGFFQWRIVPLITRFFPHPTGFRYKDSRTVRLGNEEDDDQ